MRLLVGVLLIGLQLFMIVYALFSPSRYYCRAPHDQQSVYNVSVTVDQKPLTGEQISKRYRLNTSHTFSATIL